MRVLFIISVLKQGRGGHYHSLNHISKEIGRKVEVAIVTVGTSESEVIKHNKYFLKHIDHNGFNILKLKKRISDICTEFDPDILHFFDVNAYNALKPLVRKKYKLVINLCGGPNPADYPEVENLVLFSKENQNWFKKRKKFSKTNMHLIPNRVNKIAVKPDAGLEKNKEDFCFIRIARIGTSYIKSFYDAIRLLEYLKNSISRPVRLYIIGTIESEDIYNDLLKKVSNNANIEVITDSEYTAEASKMLYLADAVIATGRGIMEATSLGLPVLTPAVNSDIPILVTKRNFNNFFGTNFSPRNVADSEDLAQNQKNIEEMISKPAVYSALSNTSIKLFDGNFDVQRAYAKYQDVYDQALRCNNRVSRFSDLYLKLRTAYHFYLSTKR